jgi:multiple sugar transport system permease protein
MWAMASVAITTVWWTLGFNFVLYLAGLQEIPRELYEASAVDGASPWTQLWQITIPLLRRTTILVLLLQAIASLKVFDQIYLMTEGGPNFGTRPIIGYIYDIGFTDFRTGYAAAISTLYFVLILVVSAVWLLVNRRQLREV